MVKHTATIIGIPGSGLSIPKGIDSNGLRISIDCEGKKGDLTITQGALYWRATGVHSKKKNVVRIPWAKFGEFVDTYKE